MKIFLQHELRAAYAHARAGGQALHVCATQPFIRSGTPLCFRQSKQFAHYFDQNLDRLTATSRRLGVQVVLVEYPGLERQHVDLCGKPLRRAIAMAQEIIEQEKQALMPLDLGV